MPSRLLKFLANLLCAIIAIQGLSAIEENKIILHLIHQNCNYTELEIEN